MYCCPKSMYFILEEGDLKCDCIFKAGWLVKVILLGWLTITMHYIVVLAMPNTCINLRLTPNLKSEYK